MPRCSSSGSRVCAGSRSDAEPGSDHQLTFVRQLAAAASSDDVLDQLEALLGGSEVPDGLAVDQDLRWVLVSGLARAGRFGEEQIAAELERDATIAGQEKAAAARTAQPRAEAKETAWAAVLSPDTPNETSRSIVLSFMRPDQAHLLEPYVERYLAAAETLHDEIGTHKAAVALEYLFPKPLGSPALLARVDEWLASTTAHPGARRYVVEGRADVARALDAQAFDAQG